MEYFMVFSLFGSFLWFYGLIGLLFILLVISDIRSDGYSAFFVFSVSIGILLKWSDFPVHDVFTWANIAIYLLIGFVFAIIRVYFKGVEHRKKEEQYPNSTMYYKLKHHVFRWWFMWPISLLNWAIKDLISNLWDFIYKKLEIIFDYIYNLG